jgi:hypothetical protein
MSDWYDEDFEERDEEVVELPEVRLDEPAPCHVCGKPGCINACFRCGKPICYAETYYPDDSTCGGWILDSWHNDAPDENEFYCLHCLEAVNADEVDTQMEEVPSEVPSLVAVADSGQDDLDAHPF